MFSSDWNGQKEPYMFNCDWNGHRVCLQVSGDER